MSSLALIDDVRSDYTPTPLSETGPGALQLMLDLERAGAAKARSLELPADISDAAAIGVLGFIGELKTRGNFYLGDAMLQLEKLKPDVFYQYVDSTGLAEETCRRIMRICDAVPPARRKDNLTWSTHTLVSKIGAREQNAWLGKAAREHWTYAQLKAAMKADRIEESPVLPGIEPGEVDEKLLVEAARALIRHAELAGENVICRVEDYTRVKAALGEE